MFIFMFRKMINKKNIKKSTNFLGGRTKRTKITK